MSLTLLLTVATAWASGLDAPQLGTLSSGPATADAAAVQHNPAMLAALPEGEVIFGVGLVTGQATVQRVRQGSYPWTDGLVVQTPVAAEDLDPSRTGPADTVAAVPLAPTAGLYVAGPLIPGKLVMGGGIGVPYAAALAFPDDGAQRFAVQEAAILVGQATVSLAGTPHPMVRLGIGGSYVGGVANLRKVQDFAGLDLLGDALADPPIGQDNGLGANAPSTLREQDVFARPTVLRDAIGHGFSFQAGIAVHPTEALTIGLSYVHGADLSFEGGFQLDLDDPFFTEDLAAQGLRYPRQVEGAGTLVLPLPHRIQGAIGWDVSPFVRLDVEAHGVLWSRVQAFGITLTSPDLAQPELGVPDTASSDVPRQWQDAVHVRVRVTGTPGPRARVVGLLGYESPAAPDATVDASSVDGHRLVMGLGGGFAVSPRVSIVPEARLAAIVPRTVTTSTYDLGNGTYTLLLAQIGLNLQASFGKQGTP